VRDAKREREAREQRGAARWYVIGFKEGRRSGWGRVRRKGSTSHRGDNHLLRIDVLTAGWRVNALVVEFEDTLNEEASQYCVWTTHRQLGTPR
jgi:hypothetical protein